MNNVRPEDPEAAYGAEALLFDKYLLLRKGKKNYALLVVN